MPIKENDFIASNIGEAVKRNCQKYVCISCSGSGKNTRTRYNTGDDCGWCEGFGFKLNENYDPNKPTLKS